MLIYSKPLNGAVKFGVSLMADVKWIKITTDMFDNRKIKHLRRLPDGDSIVLIWVMLLTLAGRCNSGGMIFLTENIPYTPKMLADELDFEESTVQLALTDLEQLSMIHTNGDGFLAVTGWEKHQNIEGMEKIRESKRLAQARWRAKKALESSTVDTTVDTTEIENNNAEEDIEEESEEDKKISTVSKDTVRSTDVLRIAEAWNDLSSLGISSISKITQGTKREEMLKKRIKDYGIDTIIKAIDNIRNSDFLQGKNSSGFTITFDWFIKPNNFPKVLEGNYDNMKGGGNSGKYRQASCEDTEYGVCL